MGTLRYTTVRFAGAPVELHRRHLKVLDVGHVLAVLLERGEHSCAPAGDVTVDTGRHDRGVNELGRDAGNAVQGALHRLVRSVGGRSRFSVAKHCQKIVQVFGGSGKRYHSMMARALLALALLALLACPRTRGGGDNETWEIEWEFTSGQTTYKFPIKRKPRPVGRPEGCRAKYYGVTEESLFARPPLKQRHGDGLRVARLNQTLTGEGSAQEDQRGGGFDERGSPSPKPSTTSGSCGTSRRSCLPIGTSWIGS